MKKKKHNRKVEWIDNMKKELQGLEKSPKTNIYMDSFRAALKIELNRKTVNHNELNGFRSKRFIVVVSSKEDNKVDV